MDNPIVIDISLHWAAVILYMLATVVNTYGLIFKKDGVEKASYFIVIAGLLIHGIVLVYRWNLTGHGPYTVKYEVFSSNAWMILFIFLIFSRIFPKIKPTSIFVFPSSFLLLAIGLSLNPEVKKLPPSLKSIWLIPHGIFYNIALGTILIAVTFSVFYILKKKTEIKWLQKLPDVETIDVYAYRFAGFGFIFWAIAVLSGSIWAYQSWGRFWAWDPVETWSLVTWIFFGIYLHLRRFFGWKGEKAAYFFILCFLISLVSVFFIPYIESSIHSSYPK
jgi:cytochrome c-type biogenesis protein CcsB